MKINLIQAFRLDRTFPVNFKKNDINHFKDDLSVTIKPFHIKVLRNCFVVQLFVFSGPLLLYDYCFTRPPGFAKIIKSYFKLILFKQRAVPKGIWVLDQWSSGYFHWLTEALPRIIISLNFKKDFSVLIPRYFMNQEYITSSLQILKVPVTQYSLNERIKVKNILLPSHLQPAQYCPDQIKMVRNLFRSSINSVNSKKSKIYISRKHAGRRKIINESDLLKLLTKYNIKLVQMENYSFSEQIEMMSNCDFLISNHGAGLTNMIFMPDNSTVVELKADSIDINNCFFNLSDAIGFKYYYTINYTSSTEIQKADISVDLVKLDNLLKELFFQ